MKIETREINFTSSALLQRILQHYFMKRGLIYLVFIITLVSSIIYRNEGFMALSVIGGIILWSLYEIWNYRKYTLSASLKHNFGRYTLTINNTGINKISGEEINKLKWKEITRAKKFNASVILYFGENGMLLVPSNSFSDKTSWGEFQSYIKGKY